jgi:hypothetical protein
MSKEAGPSLKVHKEQKITLKIRANRTIKDRQMTQKVKMKDRKCLRDLKHRILERLSLLVEPSRQILEVLLRIKKSQKLPKMSQRRTSQNLPNLQADQYQTQIEVEVVKQIEEIIHLHLVAANLIKGGRI